MIATFFTRAAKPEGSMGAEFDKARLSTGACGQGESEPQHSTRLESPRRADSMRIPTDSVLSRLGHKLNRKTIQSKTILFYSESPYSSDAKKTIWTTALLQVRVLNTLDRNTVKETKI